MSSVMPFFRSPSRSSNTSRSGAGRRGRYSAGVLVTAVLVVGPALSAQAHVHVHPDTTVGGSDAELAFSVPSESPTASTTTLSITLPQDHPFPEIATRVTPGWTVKVITDPLPKPVVLEGTTLTEAAHTVTWTAKPGYAIPPGQYQDFYLSVGPLPDSGDVVFTAKQTYSDGSVVAWDQQAAAGAAEPEHPAPSFAITAAPDAAGAGGAQADTAVAASSTDGFSRWLGGAGLLAGLAAIGLIVARRSPRRPPSQTLADDRTLDARTAADRLPSA